MAERGYHRFKRGSLPALPSWVRLPEHIRGLMLLLLIALQVLTLLDFVAQRELAKRGETLVGLVPGNPKMKTTRPSAERLLARFKNLHMMIKGTETHIEGEIVELLTPLQLHYTLHRVFCQSDFSNQTVDHKSSQRIARPAAQLLDLAIQQEQVGIY